jgi:hypothetical protein
MYRPSAADSRRDALSSLNKTVLWGPWLPAPAHSPNRPRPPHHSTSSAMNLGTPSRFGSATTRIDHANGVTSHWVCVVTFSLKPLGRSRRIGPVTRVYFEKRLLAVEGAIEQMLADPEQAGSPEAHGISSSLASTLKPIPNRLRIEHTEAVSILLSEIDIREYPVPGQCRAQGDSSIRIDCRGAPKFVESMSLSSPFHHTLGQCAKLVIIRDLSRRQRDKRV